MSIRLTVAIMAVVFLCATAVSAFSTDEESTVADSWGKAYAALKKAQIENPDAGKKTYPVKGFNGKAAENTVDAYQKSFTKTAAKPSYNLNIGGISGIGNQ